jgi:hypothetical protein
MRILACLLLMAGCGATPAPVAPPAPPGEAKADGAATLYLGRTSYCPDSAPYDAFDTVSYSRAGGRYQALAFTAGAGDQPDIAIATDEATPDARPQAWLEDAAGDVILAHANDDCSPNFDVSTSSLARGGVYYLIFANKLDADATFRLRIDCTQGDCADTHDCGVPVPLP